jgi:hypothetical protein
VGDRRRQFYTKQLAQLEEELAAVEDDLETAATERDRLRLSKDAESLLKKIDEFEAKLAECDAESETPAVRDRGFEKALQKLDNHQAKAIAAQICQKLNQEGGAVLFFLQKTKKQMGHFCLEEVLQVLLGDQIVDGQVMGAYRRIPVDLDSAISRFDEVEFLIRLASYLNLEAVQDIATLQQQIRETIRTSIDEGTTIFLEIKSLDDLLEQANFLDWFIEEFWKPLIDEVSAVSQKFKSKFIVALVADSEILDCTSPDYPAAYFCEGDVYDCYKLLDLPLPDWSEDDIYDWLVRFRTLSPILKTEDTLGLQRRANRIHRNSDGIPQLVCANLQELFR